MESLKKTDVKQETEDKLLTPLQKFRPGYLWVSDFTRQSWCEQQMYYMFTVPTIVEEDPVMTAGSNLHLARGMIILNHDGSCSKTLVLIKTTWVSSFRRTTDYQSEE